MSYKASPKASPYSSTSPSSSLQSLQSLVHSSPKSVVATVGVLAVSLLYFACSPSLDPLLVLCWDVFVFFFPVPLINALESRFYTSPPSSDQSNITFPILSYEDKSDALLNVLIAIPLASLIMRPLKARLQQQQQRRRQALRARGSLAGKPYPPAARSLPPGLGNLDNSCFQNSTLQGLSSLSSLPTYLLGPSGDGTFPMPLPKLVSHNLHALHVSLNSARQYGTTLWAPRPLQLINSWQPQDAQEYYSKLLDEIDKEMIQATKALQQQYDPSNTIDPGLHQPIGRGRGEVVDTKADQEGHNEQRERPSVPPFVANNLASGEWKPPRNPLEGLLAQRVSCVTCGFSEGLSLSPFNCVTVHLGYDTDPQNLYDLLSTYTAIEQIDGVQCGKCSLVRYQKVMTDLLEGRPDDFPLKKEYMERLQSVRQALEEDDYEDATVTKKCKLGPKNLVTGTKTKQVAIARPPQSLVIHVNRSVFVESTGNMMKNKAPVLFPRQLDLGPWCLGSAPDTIVESVLLKKSEEPLRDSPTDSPILSSDLRTKTVVNATVTETDDTDGRALKKAKKENKVDGCKIDTLDDSLEEERWVLNPKTSMVANSLSRTMVNGPLYDLTAVVIHFGNHNDGHYACYRKVRIPLEEEEEEDDDDDSNEFIKDEEEYGDKGDGQEDKDKDNEDKDTSKKRKSRTRDLVHKSIQDRKDKKEKKEKGVSKKELRLLKKKEKEEKIAQKRTKKRSSSQLSENQPNDSPESVSSPSSTLDSTSVSTDSPGEDTIDTPASSLDTLSEEDKAEGSNMNTASEQDPEGLSVSASDVEDRDSDYFSEEETMSSSQSPSSPEHSDDRDTDAGAAVGPPQTARFQEQWFRFSDESVTRVDEEVVLRQSSVFMLFYECVDPHTARRPPQAQDKHAQDTQRLSPDDMVDDVETLTADGQSTGPSIESQSDDTEMTVPSRARL